MSGEKYFPPQKKICHLLYFFLIFLIFSSFGVALERHTGLLYNNFYPGTLEVTMRHLPPTPRFCRSQQFCDSTVLRERSRDPTSICSASNEAGTVMATAVLSIQGQYRALCIRDGGQSHFKVIYYVIYNVSYNDI